MWCKALSTTLDSLRVGQVAAELGSPLLPSSVTPNFNISWRNKIISELSRWVKEPVNNISLVNFAS